MYAGFPSVAAAPPLRRVQSPPLLSPALGLCSMTP
jgi:hypothetical protein